MLTSAYERAMFGASANDDARPKRPSVIDQAIRAIGRDNYSIEPKGCYSVWENGRWHRHLTLQQFVEAANRKLKLQGKPQITANPAWRQ